MQEPKKSTPARKAWYQKAMEIALLCNTNFTSKATEIPSTNAAVWKPAEINSNKHTTKIRKCSLLSVTTSLTRVCLCVPISSYTPILQTDIVSSSRSTSSSSNIFFYPSRTTLSKPPPLTPHHPHLQIAADQGRRGFRGKSLRDDVLMRRFVIEEEAMWVQQLVMKRRRMRMNQMEVIRRRSCITRTQLGPSPLSRMVVAQELN